MEKTERKVKNLYTGTHIGQSAAQKPMLERKKEEEALSPFFLPCKKKHTCTQEKERGGKEEEGGKETETLAFSSS